MKKILIVGLIIGVLVIGLIGFYFFNSKSKGKTFCPDYDGNQQECLSHSECKWSSDRNECDSTDMVQEDDEDDNDEELDDEELNPELENIVVPNNPSNELCKGIPLSGKPPYTERYLCLAVVNHDERFCEGIDEENEKLMCLAFAKRDSSYCEQVQGQDAKHVCYYQLAVSSKNADFCSEISYSQHEKEQCYFNFMSNLYAWNKSNEIKAEYCNQLDTPDRNTCFALKARDVSLCGDNPPCLTFFEQDISFCDEHPELPCCIKDRAKTSKDVSICELLTQPDRDNCVGSYCTRTELDVNICDTIIDIEERQDRYIELAITWGNW